MPAFLQLADMVALIFRIAVRHPQPIQGFVYHPALRQHTVGQTHLKAQLDPGQIGFQGFQQGVRDRF